MSTDRTDRIRRCVGDLYQVVAELESIFPGRPFTPDGHMVGSIGECLVADAYDLELMPPSAAGAPGISRAAGTNIGSGTERGGGSPVPTGIQTA